VSEPRTAADTEAGERLIIAHWHEHDLTGDVVKVEAEARERGAVAERERLRTAARQRIDEAKSYSEASHWADVHNLVLMLASDPTP
jgi:hypothetical protein